MKKVVSICILLAAVACGDDPMPVEPTPMPDPTPEPPPAAATHTEVQTQIFNPKCIDCHGGSSPAGGLDLSPGISFTALVNVRSRQANAFLVLPSDADNSYLVRKIERRSDIEGTPMPPLDSDALTQGEISLVRSWIDDGAQLN